MASQNQQMTVRSCLSISFKLSPLVNIYERSSVNIATLCGSMEVFGKTGIFGLLEMLIFLGVYFSFLVFL